MDNHFYKDQKIVVTGGAGFIGSHLVRELLNLKAKVTVLDDFSTGNRKTLPDHENLKIVSGSVTDSKLVGEIVRGSAVVFHQAARNILVSLSDPVDDCGTNILGTLHVLMAAKETPTVKRVVYASTDSLYGNSRYLPINEEDSPSTLSPYAVSKFAGENYCKAFYESYGISVTVLRYANVFGPGNGPIAVHGGVVDDFIKCALSQKPIPIHGDGEQTRDFIFVDDVVEATLLSAVSSKAEGQVYNVGSGFETTINNLAQKVIELTRKKTSLEYMDRKDIDNIRRRALNIEKIRKDIRWTPSSTLEQGLKKTITWLQNVRV